MGLLHLEHVPEEIGLGAEEGLHHDRLEAVEVRRHLDGGGHAVDQEGVLVDLRRQEEPLAARLDRVGQVDPARGQPVADQEVLGGDLAGARGVPGGKTSGVIP